MKRTLLGIPTLLVALSPVLATSLVAQTAQDSAIYENRCGHCHSNAKNLAKRTLRRSGEQLLTRERGIELRQFLRQHGRATPGEAERINALLRTYLLAD